MSIRKLLVLILGGVVLTGFLVIGTADGNMSFEDVAIAAAFTTGAAFAYALLNINRGDDDDDKQDW